MVDARELGGELHAHVGARHQDAVCTTRPSPAHGAPARDVSRVSVLGLRPLRGLRFLRSEPVERPCWDLLWKKFDLGTKIYLSAPRPTRRKALGGVILYPDGT